MTFDREVQARVAANGRNTELQSRARDFVEASLGAQYSYNFSWLGRPIIQYPQDIVALQELVWSTQPDLIIETGIAHGGSIILSASLLELNAACGGPADAEVIAVDIDIRAHNRLAIEQHPLFKRITLIEGSSTAPEVVEQIANLAGSRRRVMVSLDSNHTHDHVLGELDVYAPLTSVGCYCIVFDTIVEEMPAELSDDRPWGPGNSPMTAVRTFLASHPEFVVDTSIEDKLLMTVAPGGYLRRVS